MSVTLHAPEVRTIPTFEFREVDGTESGSFLEGTAVPYNTWANIGWFMEQHAPGSFARSIKEAARGLPLLLFHNNQSFPIGVSHEWRDGDDRLGVVWKIDTSDELAVEGARKARNGFLTGLSIGFAPIRSDWEYVRAEDWDPDAGKVDRVTRQESRLLEVSLTPTPAFAGAQVQLVRSRDAAKSSRAAEMGARPRLERAREQLAALRRA